LGSVRVPATRRVGEDPGAGLAERAGARAQLAEQALGVGQERPLAWQLADRRVERLRAPR
jgi:hypothetical protein